MSEGSGFSGNMTPGAAPGVPLRRIVRKSHVYARPVDSAADESWWKSALGLHGRLGWLRETLIYLLALAPVPVSAMSAGPVHPTVTVIATVACLALRRRYPTAALVFGGVTTGTAQAVLSYGAGRRMGSLPRLAGAVAGSLVVNVLSPFLWGQSLVPTVLASAFTVGITMWLVVLPAVVGRSAARRAALVEALRERAMYLERERRSLVSEARTRERARIAVDMHDSLGHQLTLLSVHAGGMELTAKDPAQAEAAATLHTTARAAMQELREIIGVLGRENEDDPKQARLLEHLPTLLDTARTSGAKIDHVERGDTSEVPRPVQNAIYRVVQEGLTNAMRHAPGGAVLVRLSYEDDTVIIEVINEKATQPPQRGLGGGKGLTGLRERVHLTGGVLHAATTTDGGYRVAAVLPLDAAPASEPVDDLTWIETVGSDDLTTHPLARTDVGTLLHTLRHRPVLAALTVACAIVLGAVVFVGGAAWTFNHNGPIVPSEQFGEPAIGQGEDEVARRFGPPSADVGARLEQEIGSPPVGLHCDYYYGDTPPSPEAELVIAYRFCFTDGRLAESEQFAVRKPF